MIILFLLVRFYSYVCRFFFGQSCVLIFLTWFVYEEFTLPKEKRMMSHPCKGPFASGMFFALLLWHYEFEFYNIFYSSYLLGSIQSFHSLLFPDLWIQRYKQEKRRWNLAIDNFNVIREAKQHYLKFFWNENSIYCVLSNTLHFLKILKYLGRHTV